MPIDLKRERERQATFKVGSQGKNWRPLEGENIIRILTFKHKVTKEDVATGLYAKEALGETLEEFCYPFVIHFDVHPENPKIPVKSNREIMDLYFKLKKEDPAKALRIRPNKKFAMNIIDVNHPENGVQVYLAPKSIRAVIGDYLMDKDYGDSIFGPKGRDFKIIYGGPKAEVKEMYKVIIREKDKCRPMNSKVTNLTLDLYSPENNSGFGQEITTLGSVKLPDVKSASLASDKPAVMKDQIDDIFDAE